MEAESGVNAKEFAKITGIHFNTVYKMIKTNEIKAIKKGRSYIIPNKELENYKQLVSIESLKYAKNRLEIYKEFESATLKSLNLRINELRSSAKEINKFKIIIKSKDDISFLDELSKELKIIKNTINRIENIKDDYIRTSSLVEGQSSICEGIEAHSNNMKNLIKNRVENIEEANNQTKE